MINKIKTERRWLLPLLLLVLLTPFTPAIDLACANFFYEMGAGSVNHFVRTPLLTFLYDYGPWPGNLLAAAAALLFLFSYFLRGARKFRRPALLVLFTVAIGSGFITNALLKEYWGRPRPTQLEQFGGGQKFRAFYHPNFFSQPEPSKSFPCGHCTIGFAFFGLMLAARRLGYRRLEAASFAIALLLGTALGLTRMAQGGHFFSDLLIGGLVIWWTALSFDWLIYADRVSFEENCSASA